MAINLHLTPTVPRKHPSIAGAFLLLALVSVRPRLSPRLFLSCYTGQESGNASPNRQT